MRFNIPYDSKQEQITLNHLKHTFKESSDKRGKTISNQRRYSSSSYDVLEELGIKRIEDKGWNGLGIEAVV